MSGAQFTAVVLAVAMAVCGVWDVYAAARWGVDSTVSRLVMSVAVRYPIVPLLVGMLLGHLFWPQVPPAIQQNGNGGSTVHLHGDPP